ncbi:carboxypeptidase-like regulatory domain-containing protein [Kocuria rhizosphaericola]|uniref:carboxypeptidase-like regulatory domain-containing protein n=1 Tax=Kocuria rhizosphaericola TaxID=3376284 RepID=UPI00379FD14B
MSVSRAALTALTDLVAATVAPDEVAVAGEPHDHPAAVSVVPLALDRVSRSRRDGPLLDLELRVALVCTGPRDLENTESLLVVLERRSACTVSALDRTTWPDVPHGLGCAVTVPLSVRLDEPAGPPVREPMKIRTTVGRRLSGTVVGADGRGVPGVQIRGHVSAGTATSDAKGRFEVLTSQEDSQRLTAELGGTARTVTVAARDAPVTIRWE